MILVDGIPAAAIGRRMIELGLAHIPPPPPPKPVRGKRYNPKHASYMREWRLKRTKSRNNALATETETLILPSTRRISP